MEWNLRQQAAQKFLLYAYFGIVDKDNGDTRAKKCAQRAYLDANRNIVFNSKLKESEGNRGERNKYIKRMFQEEISKLIIEEIKKIDISKSFDLQHHDICSMIINKSQELCWKEDNKSERILEKQLTYGQAQKWLNMTLKYMWLIGLLDDSFTKYLHVPVDRYIMEAAAGRNRYKGKSTDGIDVSLPGKNGEKINSYSDDKVLSWSKWEGVKDFKEADKSDYHCFQKVLREKLDKISPIEWEGDAWIRVAETVKESEQKKFSDITFNFKISEET